MERQLAQVNVARLLAPVDAPETSAFVAALDPINAQADTAPGFVWRLQTEAGDATSLRVFDDGMIIINMSTWATFDDLAAFVYRSGHTEIMRRRREWFSRMAEAHLALWWVPAGHHPSPAEASDRLELLRRLGPSPDAFTFRRQHPPPSDDASSVVDDDRWGCPAP
jgi:hypothetical protein